MPVEWLFQWWNAVYTVPLACVLVFLTISSLVGVIGGAMGELSHLGGGNNAEADADLDVDAHVEPGVDVDADLDVDADVDAGPHVDAAHVDAASHHHSAACGHADPGPVVGALLFLGMGQAPLTLVLQLLVLVWGVVGISLHQAVKASGPYALLWSVPVTLFASVLVTRSVAAFIGRTFKPFETASVKRHQIVGRTGRVVFPVSEDEGTIHVRDQHGTLHRVRARARHERLESGREIIVVGFDPRDNTYEVDDASAFADRD